MFAMTCRRIAMVLAALCLWALATGTASAQNCWNGGKSDINFGTLSKGGTSDANGDVKLTCQSAWNTPTYFLMCVYAPGYPTPADINPRLMSNNNAGGVSRTMPYNLYANAGRTQVIGPLGNGSYTTYVFTPQSAVQGQTTFTIPIYARASAASDLPGGQTFYSYGNNISVVWAAGTGAPPASCNSSAIQTGTETIQIQTQAVTSNSCAVSVSATDMDFGSTSSLAAARDSTSTIKLSCPPNTSWWLGLNNGLHATGTQRRMAGPAGDLVTYELYLDAARGQRWGSTQGSDTFSGSGGNPASVTVFGRVPAQPGVTPGAYSDTITVTLTY
mgnify:CR=1 FL=1